MSRLLDQANQILTEKQSKILPENIKSGITCFGVTGNVTELAGEEIVITPSIEEQIITPSEGKNGITSATVNAVTSEIDVNIIAENIKKDVSILGVNGTYEGSGGGSGDVKLFATEEEMQADTTAQEGDLAVVYGSEIQNATVDSQFQVATFPDTVVLDTAITDGVEVRYSAVDSSVMFDCMGQLDSSNFMMDCYTETEEIMVQYTSSDGITYTRTDTTGNPVDFGTEICYAYPEMWNDAIGKFIQVGGNIFEGLFEYETIEDKTKAAFVSNIRYENEVIYNINRKDGYVFNDYIKVFNDVSTYLETTPSRILIIKTNNIITVYCYKLAVGDATMGNITLCNGKVYAGLISTNLANFTNYKFVFSEDLSSYEVTVLTPINIANEYYYLDEIPSTAEITSIQTPGTYPNDIDVVYYDTSAITGTIAIGYGEQSSYRPASTQLSATADYVYEKNFLR